MATSYSGRTLREIVRVVASRFLGIVILFVVVVGAVVLATLVQPKEFRSEAMVSARPSRIIGPLATSSESLREKVTLFVLDQRQIILSDSVIASALMRLEGIDYDGIPVPISDATSLLPEPEKPEKPEKPEVRPVGAGPEVLPWYKPETIEQFISDRGERYREARKRIGVVTPGGQDAQFTQNFTLRVDWPEEPKVANEANEPVREFATRRARTVCKYVWEAYQGRRKQLDLEDANASREVVVLSLEPARVSLEKARAAMKAFVAKEVRGDLTTVINMTSSEGAGAITGTPSLATEFQAELNRVEVRIAEAKALKVAVETELEKAPGTPVVVPDAVTAANPSITKFQDKIVSLKLTISNLTPKYTDTYRELVDTRAELKAVEQGLFDELTKQKTRLGQELDVLTARQDTLAGIATRASDRVDDLAEKAVPYQQLQDDEDTAKSNYDVEYSRVMEAARTQAAAAVPVLVRLLDGPSLPDPAAPRRPIFWLNVLIAAVSGLVLALVYAFLADHFDHSLKSIDDAERTLGVPVLASVPKLGRNIIRTC